MLRHRTLYEVPLLNRFVDRDLDTPIPAMYRIYEHIMLDQSIELRNELEAFWFKSEWKVSDIPNPEDSDVERYAVLSCIPALLVLAFNKRIELGLPRNAPSIFTHDQLDVWRSQEREYEKEPEWVTGVPKLEETLAIPHWDNDQKSFVVLNNFNDSRASKAFAK